MPEVLAVLRSAFDNCDKPVATVVVVSRKPAMVCVGVVALRSLARTFAVAIGNSAAVPTGIPARATN